MTRWLVGGGATELSRTFIGLELKRGEQQLWCPASVLALFTFFLKMINCSQVRESFFSGSQFALFLLQRPVQARDEFEEAPAEALLFGFPLQRAKPGLLVPRRPRRRAPHVAARAGAAGQRGLGGGEELAGGPQALRPGRLPLLLLGRRQAGLVDGLVLRGRAEDAAAAAGAARAAQRSPGGRAGRAQAAVDPRRLQRLVHGGVAHHDACQRRERDLSSHTHTK